MTTFVCNDCEGSPCYYKLKKRDSDRLLYFDHIPTICPWEDCISDHPGYRLTGETIKAHWRKV